MSMSDGGSVDLREVLDIIRRQARLIVLTLVLGVGAAGLFAVSATPLFTATALILVDPSQKNILSPQETYGPPGPSENARLESEVEILGSDTVAMATVAAAGLVADPEFGPQLGLTGKLRTAIGLGEAAPPSGEALVARTLRRLHEATTIRRRGLTHVIAVSVTARDPANAARIANLLAQTYIELQIRSKVTAALGSRDILASLLAGARAAMVQAEDGLGNYIDDNIDRFARESGSAEVAALRTRLIETNARLERSGDRLAAARGALEAGDWPGLARTLEDEALGSLSRQRADLERQLGQVAAGTRPEVDLRAGLARLEQSLSDRAQAAVSGLQGEVSALREGSSEMRAQVRQAVLGSGLPSATLAEIFSLQQEADIAQRQYQTLLSRQRDLETQAVVQVADSRIVSAALPPQVASFPDRGLVLMLALVASGGLGLGIALLNEYYLGGITSAAQLANLLPVPVVGTIRRVERGADRAPDRAPDRASVADTVIAAPLSVYAEALRRLRAAIDRSAPAREGPGRVVVVVSSIPGEGKSSLSLALARTYAGAGQHALVIDADLRKPALHRYLGLEPDYGLFDYLRAPDDLQDGEADVERAYHLDPLSSAGVIAGQGRANQPTDQLLQSAAFEQVLDTARDGFDVVILDTPPILPVVDARHAMAHADAVVLCVRYGVTSQSDLREAHAQIVDSIRPGTPVLAVLNQDEGRIRSYRYAGYYAEYTTDGA